MTEQQTPETARPSRVARRFKRRDWKARPRRRHPGTLDPRQVEGIALHWPGMKNALPPRIDAIAAALRGWQDYHMDEHGWSDIAYQVAIDQLGNRWRLRGLRNRSAANGDTAVNLRYGAALLILGPGEAPTDAMRLQVRQVVSDHRRLFSESHRIVGHGEIRPDGGTDCPGAMVERFIKAGAFEPVKRWSPARQAEVEG